MLEVLWVKQHFFRKIEGMRLTEKMIRFYQNNKNQQKLEADQPKNEEQEQLTQISKNYNSPKEKTTHVSIRHDQDEEEEEKKMTEHAENIEHQAHNPNNQKEINNISQNNQNDNHNDDEEELKNDDVIDYKAILEWWKDLKKSFVLKNISAVIKYFNLKLEGVVERQISKKVLIKLIFLISI